MKKHFLILIAAGFFSFSNAQDSKFYAGVGLGYATAGGDVADELDLSGGLNINFLNLGYRINETWGVTANLSSSGHPIDDTDSAVGIGLFSIGPMISFPVGNMIWDFKPQYAFSAKGVIRGEDAQNSLLGDLEDVEFSGDAFIIGNSLVMGTSKGFSWSIDFDYVFGKFNKVEGPGGSADIDEDNKFNNFKIGAGVRYNF
jgi:opacity protein-like surface antigen